MLDYTTDLLDKCLQQSREWREKEQNGEAGLLERLIREQDGEENPNYILKYWCYFKAFHEHGQESLYLDNDITKFKGYFYLAAKAGKSCFALYEKGYRSATHLSFMSPSVLENKNTNMQKEDNIEGLIILILPHMRSLRAAEIWQKSLPQRTRRWRQY